MSESLSELLSELRLGLPPRARLYALSNLNAAQGRELAATWAELPAATRREVVLALTEIAESDFEVDFGAAFRVALDDPDPLTRKAAIDGLWEDEDVRLIPVLVACLQGDRVPDVRAAAATALGRFLLLGELGKIRPAFHRSAYQALLAAHAAESEESTMRRRVLESLAYSGEPEVSALIRQAYQHADDQERISAVFSMGRSGDEQWSSCVLAELPSPDPAMRYEAARACGELGLREAAAALVELTEDTDPEVQEAAVWALGQIGGDEARAALRRCARTENEALRDAALDALQELEFLHGDLSTIMFPFDLDEQDDGEGLAG
jgi:HEAT repeat protein